MYIMQTFVLACISRAIVRIQQSVQGETRFGSNYCRILSATGAPLSSLPTSMHPLPRLCCKACVFASTLQSQSCTTWKGGKETKDTRHRHHRMRGKTEGKN